MKRLLPAAALAGCLHGALLFMEFGKPLAVRPAIEPVRRIAVSLASSPVEMPKTKKKEVKAEQKVVKKTRPLVDEEKKAGKAVPLPAKASALVPVQPPAPRETPEVTAAGPPQSEEADNPPRQARAAQIVYKATPLYEVNPPPNYPRLARRRGFEGTVLLEALVTTSGRVADLRLIESSGHRILDKAAFKAVHNWRFTPGNLAGKPHEMRVRVPVRFTLHD